MQISAFMLAFNKRKRKEVKLPLFGKRNDRAFGSIILDTHHPILISFHYETIYNLPLGSRIIRTTLEKSLIDCDWGSPDLPAFERWLLIAKLTFSSTSFSILLSSCIFLFTIQSNHSIRSSDKFLSYLWANNGRTRFFFHIILSNYVPFRVTLEQILQNVTLSTCSLSNLHEKLFCYETSYGLRLIKLFFLDRRGKFKFLEIKLLLLQFKHNLQLKLLHFESKIVHVNTFTATLKSHVSPRTSREYFYYSKHTMAN